MNSTAPATSAATTPPALPGSPSELFLVGYTGTELPKELAVRFARGDYGGLIFFARNFADLVSADADPRTRILAIAELLERIGTSYAPQGPLAELPPILSIDHEGGRVQRIKAPLTVFPPMATLRGRDGATAAAVGRAMALELAAVGINVNFAPVLDVATNPANPIIGDRAFGTAIDEATHQALAFLAGLEESGAVRGCGKHYPGHGDTSTDSHLTLPSVHKSATDLYSVELAPFRAAVARGIGMLMTAHVVYPAVDARPATLSKRWLHDILRTELGFEGVVVSDDLDMKAVVGGQLEPILGHSDDSQVVVESLLAGCDAFLLCHDPDRQARAEEALTQAARKHEAVRARLAESIGRVRRFRRSLAWPRIDRARLVQLPISEHQALATTLRGA